jgi:hypothetical protein
MCFLPFVEGEVVDRNIDVLVLQQLLQFLIGYVEVEGIGTVEVVVLGILVFVVAAQSLWLTYERPL